MIHMSVGRGVFASVVGVSYSRFLERHDKELLKEQTKKHSEILQQLARNRKPDVFVFAVEKQTVSQLFS